MSDPIQAAAEAFVGGEGDEAKRLMYDFMTGKEREIVRAQAGRVVAAYLRAVREDSPRWWLDYGIGAEVLLAELEAAE